jgi:hypothetical protein
VSASPWVPAWAAPWVSSSATFPWGLRLVLRLACWLVLPSPDAAGDCACALPTSATPERCIRADAASGSAARMQGLLSMLKVIWKICLVLAAVLIAAFITCLPWTRLDELPGNEGYAYFLLSIVWAPIALLAGLFAGAMFAFMLWPKRPGNPRAKDPPAPARSEPPRSEFEA